MSYRLKTEEEPFGYKEYDDYEDALELSDEDQDLENNFESDVLELPDTEQEVVGTSALRIEDRTGVARKDRRKGRRDPRTIKALVLHQMAFNRGSNPDRYNQVTAHYAILPDGRILQLHPVSALLWASNGFNRKSVAVEFAGNFPNTKGKCWEAGKFGCHRLSQAQIKAGRYLVKHLIREIGLTHIFAHRQAASTRENCPGPDIWYNVGQWAVDNLGLKDGGPDFKLRPGHPIPDAWRNWGNTKGKERELYPGAFDSAELPADSEDPSGELWSEADQEALDELDALETPLPVSDREDETRGPVFDDDSEFFEPETDQESGSLSSFFKDSPRLANAALPPDKRVAVVRSWPSTRKSLAKTYNRLGGLMRTIAQDIGVEVETALAVWQIESGGRSHQAGKAVIRFENHLLFKLWGKSNEALYDRYFRYGGRNGQPGKSWHNHQFREDQNGAFQSFHGDQGLEYRVLSLASRLAGDDIALRCISIGGPQIVISNYKMIGYASPRAMYDAFQSSERYHVLGFFDFCRQKRGPQKGDLLKHLRQRNWPEFAKYYNGFGQYKKYGGKIANAFQHAKAMLA